MRYIHLEAYRDAEKHENYWAIQLQNKTNGEIYLHKVSSSHAEILDEIASLAYEETYKITFADYTDNIHMKP